MQLYISHYLTIFVDYYSICKSFFFFLTIFYSFFLSLYLSPLQYNGLGEIWEQHPVTSSFIDQRDLDDEQDLDDK